MDELYRQVATEVMGRTINEGVRIDPFDLIAEMQRQGWEYEVRSVPDHGLHFANFMRGKYDPDTDEWSVTYPWLGATAAKAISTAALNAVRRVAESDEDV